ncbi:MAG: hypothetical protein IKS05_03535, partial [Oscillospiraceae bacterium]|nr:hypothetical protein [Oscillospiraceae bacterium]
MIVFFKLQFEKLRYYYLLSFMYSLLSKDPVLSDVVGSAANASDCLPAANRASTARPLYYRVVAFIDLKRGLCYNAEDVVDWLR